MLRTSQGRQRHSTRNLLLFLVAIEPLLRPFAPFCLEKIRERVRSFACPRGIWEQYMYIRCGETG
jgi:hypothetical protein